MSVCKSLKDSVNRKKDVNFHIETLEIKLKELEQSKNEQEIQIIRLRRDNQYLMSRWQVHEKQYKRTMQKLKDILESFDESLDEVTGKLEELKFRTE